jgi:hypothetical protein
MLSSSDKDQLIDALCLTAEAMGNVITPSVAMMMADDLSDYSLPELGRALCACRRENKGRLTVADVIQHCQTEDGRPGKDEAWSIGLDSSDEYGTAIMTWEIQQAMASAKIILDEGDQVGARMAFISTYERLVRESRQINRPVDWIVSLGFDKDRRASAIQQAVQLNRIPQIEADRHLSRLQLSAPSQTSQAIAGLITGKIVKPKEEHRQKFMSLKDIVRQRAEALAAMTPEERKADHERTLNEHNKIVKEIE